MKTILFAAFGLCAAYPLGAFAQRNPNPPTTWEEKLSDRYRLDLQPVRNPTPQSVANQPLTDADRAKLRTRANELQARIDQNPSLDAATRAKYQADIERLRLQAQSPEERRAAKQNAPR